jgi:hypothetical protein
VNADDLLVIHIITNGIAVNAPSGWTVVHNEAAVSNPKGGVFIKKAVGGETGTLSVTTVASSTGNAMMFSYTGVDTTNPLDVAAATVSDNVGTDTVTTLPSITTVTANTMLVYANGANSGSATMTGPAGSTERVDQGALAGTGAKAGALYDEPVAAIGATSTRTITLSAAFKDWGAIMALRPASTGGTPANVDAVVATGTSATPAPSISAGASVAAVASNGIAAAPVASVSAGATVTAVAAQGSGSAPAPTRSAAVNIAAVRAQASGMAPAPTVSSASAANVSAIVATASGTAPVPGVGAGATMLALNAYATTSAHTPAVMGGATVSAPVATGTATAGVPLVSGGTAMIATDITVTGTLGPKRWAANLPARTKTATLGTKRWAGTL